MRLTRFPDFVNKAFLWLNFSPGKENPFGVGNENHFNWNDIMAQS